MHLPDGLLPPGLAIAGYAVSGGTLWYTLRRIRQERDPTENIPKASLLTAAFFITSLLHIPVPPASIHLVLNGLMGIVLGTYAFPAVVIGLFFQAVMFGHGGISSLGVNAAMMGIPALLASAVFQLLKPQAQRFAFGINALSFTVGAGTLLLSAAIFVTLAITAIPADVDAGLEQRAIMIALTGYAIQAGIEGVFTSMIVAFLTRVKPELMNS
ncbi:MAG: cobalt transporter CbiM [Spirulinaceae cyanobacterium RM2_2_10]|nr:cobalt transporter CbiM [Spirulinaceae cyanobacterium SM2_1_0]NJO21385.1 cobalt transporter CbiM [Spirulinaceae cyanobacterium RM2_2_10]